MSKFWGNQSVVSDRWHDGHIHYYIDGVADALKENLHRQTPYILDQGDEAWLVRRLSAPLVASGLDRIAEHVVRSRALGIVHRGPLHAYGLSSPTVESKRLIFLPDFPVLNLQPTPQSSAGLFNIGFVGSVPARPGSPPTGWMLLDALAASRRLGARLLVAGDGVDSLKWRARALGVAKRVQFSSNFAEANAFLADVNAFYLPQSRNRLGQARTTGKLVEYLQTGRPIFTAPVGAAQCYLPPQMHLMPSSLYDGSESRALSRRVADWIALSDAEQDDCLQMLGAGQILLDGYARLSYWKHALSELVSEQKW